MGNESNEVMEERAVHSSDSYASSLSILRMPKLSVYTGDTNTFCGTSQPAKIIPSIDIKQGSFPVHLCAIAIISSGGSFPDTLPDMHAKYSHPVCKIGTISPCLHF